MSWFSLLAGDWWVEHCRFYSAKDLKGLVQAADVKLQLPADFQLQHELLRAVAHSHTPMAAIKGKGVTGRASICGTLLGFIMVVPNVFHASLLLGMGFMGMLKD